MLIDYLKGNGFGIYNVKIANLWGLETAVYVSFLLNSINENNINDFVKVNRNNIKKFTTITIERQKEIDKRLKSVGIVDFLDEDNIKLNQNCLYQILENEEPEKVEDINKFIKKKRTKQDIIKDELKTYINTTNSELRDAYSCWIDSVMAKQGWMSKKAVQSGQSLIDTYTNRDLDKALKILDIASINGYRDIQWAINVFEKDASFNAKVLPHRKEFNVSDVVKLSNDVF